MSYFKTITMLFISSILLFTFTAGPAAIQTLNNGNAVITNGAGNSPTSPIIMTNGNGSNQVDPIILGDDDPTPPPPIIDVHN